MLRILCIQPYTSGTFTVYYMERKEALPIIKTQIKLQTVHNHDIHISVNDFLHSKYIFCSIHCTVTNITYG